MATKSGANTPEKTPFYRSNYTHHLHFREIVWFQFTLDFILINSLDRSFCFQTQHVHQFLLSGFWEGDNDGNYQQQ